MPTVASGSLVSPGGQQGISGPVGGGGISALLSLSSAYNLTAADSNKYAICTGGSWTLGLPTPTLGLNYWVRNDQGIIGTTGAITIQPASGTIDGAASLALLAGQEVRILTDGTNWRTFGRQREVVIGTQDVSNVLQSAVLLPPGYRYYRFLWEGLTPVTSNAYLLFQISSDGGNTWINTAAYFSYNIYSANTTTVAGTYQGTATAASPCNNLNPSSGVASGLIEMMLWPGNANSVPNWSYNQGGYLPVNNFQGHYLGNGFYNGRVIVNALLYFMNTGNIGNSLLTVKGVV